MNLNDESKDQDGDELEAAYWRMMEGAEQARKQRVAALGWGCMVPILLLALLAVLAIANPH